MIIAVFYSFLVRKGETKMSRNLNFEGYGRWAEESSIKKPAQSLVTPPCHCGECKNWAAPSCSRPKKNCKHIILGNPRVTREQKGWGQE